MIYDKPYKNTQELITILESRNLNFNNMGFASDILNTVGYYDLINAYKKYFYKNLDPEEYKDGLNFEYLYAFYYIDKDFQNVLLNAILLVENIFKNRISQVISQNMVLINLNILLLKYFRTYLLKLIIKKFIRILSFVIYIMRKLIHLINVMQLPIIRTIITIFLHGFFLRISHLWKL